MAETAGPLDRLREALIQQLEAREGDEPRSLAALEAAAREWPAYGVAGAALCLGPEAAPLLRRLLAHDNGIVALEAAAALAALGDRAGLGVLQGPARGATNSGIESFYRHAALLLLGEPIPPAARRHRSVFYALERLLDEASA